VVANQGDAFTFTQISGDDAGWFLEDLPTDEQPEERLDIALSDFEAPDPPDDEVCDCNDELTSG
jgi:hypothetical protein